jgi:4-alpha-glucanotransferase
MNPILASSPFAAKRESSEILHRRKAGFTLKEDGRRSRTLQTKIPTFPMTLDPDKKIAGLLVPLFALKGRHDLGVGDTEALSEVIEWAAGNGFRAVQILPVNETGGDHSPYNVLSAFALDPSTITTHPSCLPELTPGDYRLITEHQDLEALRSGPVDYNAVKSLKRELLEAAWRRFQKGDGRSGRPKLFARFLDQHAAWLSDYTLYRVLLERNQGNENLSSWPPDQRNAASARTWLKGLNSTDREAFEERRQFFAFVQWIAFSQWSAVADLAEVLGVALIGDVPVGVASGGADVFASPEEFDPARSCGAPPEHVFKSDPFTEQWGQNWGFPLYRWEVMARNNFLWWRRRLRLLRSIFHLLRVDHALGFFRIYSFPWAPQRNAEFTGLSNEAAMAKTAGLLPGFIDCDDSTAENRTHNERHGEVLLGILNQELGDHRLIAEDLGEVAPYVRPVMARMGLPGFKIPMWERSPEGTMLSGESYPRISVATYATHDHAPVKTQWEEWQAGVADGGEKGAGCRRILEELLRFAGRPDLDPMTPFEGTVHMALLEGLLSCNSWIAIPMITDLLGTTQRFNVPGAVGSANWTARIDAPVSEWNLRHKELLAGWRALISKRGRG